MNEIVNKFLLAGAKFMPKMHLSEDLPIVLLDHLLKQRKNSKFQTNKRLKIHLQK